jgi:short subunit dehydrogenase-like uncharacterized protein
MWLLYGANGYTGELIAREAARRGQRPVVAGRNKQRIEALAHELECESRVFGLDDIDLQGVQAVLHCAGPFSKTSAPMVRACVEAGVHYLDITGEIAVFESIMARDAEAAERGVMLLPGVGFDVVPTDCLAATLHKRMPDAEELWLAFYSPRAELSRGTLKTMIEGIGEGGAIRKDGRIVRVPMAWDVREIPFSTGPRTAMTIPWGDVSTAYYTTGIPNIRVYNAASPKTVGRIRRLRPLLPIAALPPVRRLLQKLADRRTGPDETHRTTGRTHLWGRVAKGSREVTMTMTTPEGYAFTAISAVNAMERVLQSPKPGSFTPARALGAEFVKTVPGVEGPQ